MHEQPVLQEDLSSSYSKKYKFLCYIIVVNLPQTNYSPICIQEREEKLAGLREVHSDNGLNYNEPERKKKLFTSDNVLYTTTM